MADLNDRELTKASEIENRGKFFYIIVMKK